jgi:hypothetical protein
VTRRYFLRGAGRIVGVSTIIRHYLAGSPPTCGRLRAQSPPPSARPAPRLPPPRQSSALTPPSPQVSGVPEAPAPDTGAVPRTRASVAHLVRHRHHPSVLSVRCASVRSARAIAIKAVSAATPLVALLRPVALRRPLRRQLRLRLPVDRRAALRCVAVHRTAPPADTLRSAAPIATTATMATVGGDVVTAGRRSQQCSVMASARSSSEDSRFEGAEEVAGGGGRGSGAGEGAGKGSSGTERLFGPSPHRITAGQCPAAGARSHLRRM